MYCPKCGHETQETVRFCSRCGFNLSEVKESLTSSTDPSAKLLPLRQKDINIGAALILVGIIKAVLIMSNVRGPNEKWIGLYLLTAAFAAFLLFSQLSPRFRGLSLGATMMFIGALVALPAASAFDAAGVAMVAAILIPLILLWLPLTRAATKFFFEKESVVGESRSAITDEKIPAALPLAHQAIDIQPQRIITAEILPAPSVTENTTRQLEKD